MVSSINNIQQNILQPELSTRKITTQDNTEPLNSFADEDQAIISSEAKLQNELEKFNSGGDNAVDLAVTSVVSKTTVSAEVNVIQTKKDMIENLLDMGK